MADHPLYASLYDRMTRPIENAGLGRRRAALLAGAVGRVLEVGGGTGANLPHYPADVTVTVLEPDGAMRRKLLERLASLGEQLASKVEVHPVGVDEADFGPDSFDTVVCTLVLCT